MIKNFSFHYLKENIIYFCCSSYQVAKSVGIHDPEGRSTPPFVSLDLKESQSSSLISMSLLTYSNAPCLKNDKL